MDTNLLKIIACPVCQGPICLNQETLELICKTDSLAFPIRENIPRLLRNQARLISEQEKNYEFLLTVTPLKK
jgi:hypothetical protein